LAQDGFSSGSKYYFEDLEDVPREKWVEDFWSEICGEMTILSRGSIA
jgi:hypothetical protein